MFKNLSECEPGKMFRFADNDTIPMYEYQRYDPYYGHFIKRIQPNGPSIVVSNNIDIIFINPVNKLPMTSLFLSKQDELCFEGMTPETRSLIYYGLSALLIDIDRTADNRLHFGNDEKVHEFRQNVRQAALVRHEFIANTTPLAISLIRHFSPQD